MERSCSFHSATPSNAKKRIKGLKISGYFKREPEKMERCASTAETLQQYNEFFTPMSIKSPRDINPVVRLRKNSNRRT